MSEETKKLVENEDHTLGETGEPNVDCEHYVDAGPGTIERDPRLGIQGDVIGLGPDGKRDPGVRQQDLDGVGPDFVEKKGPGL